MLLYISNKANNSLLLSIFFELDINKKSQFLFSSLQNFILQKKFLIFFLFSFLCNIFLWWEGSKWEANLNYLDTGFTKAVQICQVLDELKLRSGTYLDETLATIGQWRILNHVILTQFWQDYFIKQDGILFILFILFIYFLSHLLYNARIKVKLCDNKRCFRCHTWCNAFRILFWYIYIWQIYEINLFLLNSNL
jgi:hypothetical protein